MNLRKIIFALLLFLVSCPWLIAQQTGVPYLLNFTFRDYAAHTQNFAVAQNKAGFMFFGNFEGVLVYDGVNWNKISTENNTKVSALHAFGNDVLVGGENEIGILKFQEGKIRFSGLGKFPPIGTIKNILPYKDKFLFVAEKGIVAWDKDTLTNFWMAKDTVHLLNVYQSRGELYAETHYRLSKLTEDGLQPLTKTRGIPNFIRTVALLENKKRTWIVTEGYGVYELKNDSIFRIAGFENKKLDDMAVETATLSKEGDLLIGTERNGVFRFSQEGKFVENINEKIGLQNNNINRIFQDRDGRIWMALNNGISVADLHLPFRFFNDKVGVKGEIYGSFIDGSSTFFFGDQGVFVLRQNKVKQLPEITSACWGMTKWGNSLFFATSKGLLQIGKQTQYITDRFTFSLLIDEKTNALYTGEISGLGKVELDNAKATDKGVVLPTEREIRQVLRHGNFLWLNISVDHVLAYNPEQEQTKLFPSENDSNLQALVSYRLNSVDESLLLSTKLGLFRFDDADFTFKPHLLFAADSTQTKNISGIFQTENHTLWYNNWKDAEIKVATREGKAFKQFDNYQLNIIKEFITWHVVSDSLGNVWMSGPEGIVSYDSRQMPRNVSFSSYFRSFTVGSDSILFQENIYDSLAMGKAKFPYELNTVKFEYGANTTAIKGTLKFQYWLEGDASGWSVWQEQSNKEFTNLSPGKYIFHVRAQNEFGIVSQEATIQFHIEKPFSQTYFAYFLYIILVIGLIYLVIWWRITALQKEKDQLEAIITERTEEVTFQKAEIEQKSQLIADKNSELERINLIVQAINAEINFSNLLNSILERLKIVKGMDAAAVLQRNADGAYVVDAFWGFTRSIFENQVFSYEEIQEAFIDGSEEFFGEIYRLDEFSSQNANVLKAWNFPKSAVTMVITIESKKEGYLVLTNNTTPSAFDERDQSLLRNLKEHLVSAFIKTSLLASVQENNKQLSQQNAIISKQQEDIRGSIHYASRIQTALMPSEEILNKNLPDHFVLLRPRDIVSGDFYWLQRVGNKVIYAAADCTGHGVPGAFVSMLGISFLNDIVNRDNLTRPSEILEALRNKIKSSLKQNDPKSEQKDGMDIALCTIDLESLELEYAGAYNSLIIVRDNELDEIKATRNPVAVYIKEKPFQNNTRQLQKGDLLYSFSDGFVDQFGGKKGKKLMAKGFKEKLMEHHQLPLDQQRENLNQYFDQWRGEYEQIDDVLVFGVKI